MLFLLYIFTCLVLVSAQAPKGPGQDKPMFRAVQPGDLTYKSREMEPCDNLYRELDGMCTNKGSDLRKMWGATNRPQFFHFDLDTLPKTPSDLPSARHVSNILFDQKMDNFDSRHLSAIAVFLGQFIDHTLVASPSSTRPEDSMPIPIPLNDSKPITAGYTMHLPFIRSARVRVAGKKQLRFPQTSLTSAVDLVNLYGPSKLRNSRLREGVHGRMKTDPQGFMPLNDRYRNAPRIGFDFFLAGDHRSNEHPVLTSLHTIFLREHNKIATELQEHMPELSDFHLFGMARRINEAQWQKIVFEEWYPSITGHNLPKYTGFKRGVDLTVSLLFSTVAFRVGHSMVSNHISRLGPANVKRKPLSLLDSFFMKANKFKMFGLDSFLRGALHSRAQKADLQVVDALRNGLFANISGENENFDLVALNIQRGRDHHIPSYNIVREKFNLSRASTFSDISSTIEIQEKLQKLYDTPDRVEAFPGLLAEDHVKGSSFGPLLLKIWQEEFTKLRDGDRFYFKSEHHRFPPDLVRKMTRLRALENSSSNIFHDILIRNTNIAAEELPRSAFFVDH